MNIYENCYA